MLKFRKKDYKYPMITREIKTGRRSIRPDFITTSFMNIGESLSQE